MKGLSKVVIVGVLGAAAPALAQPVPSTAPQPVPAPAGNPWGTPVPAPPAPAPAPAPAPVAQPITATPIVAQGVAAAPATSVTTTVPTPDDGGDWYVGGELMLCIPRGELSSLSHTARGVRATGLRRALRELDIFASVDVVPLLTPPGLSGTYFAVHGGARIGRDSATGWSLHAELGLGLQHVSANAGAMDATSTSSSGLGFLIGASAEYPLPASFKASASLSFTSSTMGFGGGTSDVEMSFWLLGAGVGRAL